MTHLRSSVIVLSLLASLSASGEAQSVTLAKLAPRADTLTVRYGTAVIGQGIMTWANRAQHFLQVYMWRSAVDGSRTIDSLWADPTSLRPQREVRVVGDTVITATFEASRVLVRTDIRRRDAGTRIILTPTPAYSSASIESLAAAMPLATNASAVFATYYAPPSQLGLQRTRIHVVSSDTVAGRVVWRVVADTPGGGTTFWIDGKGRSVIQSDVREGNALITFRR